MKILAGVPVILIFNHALTNAKNGVFEAHIPDMAKAVNVPRQRVTDAIRYMVRDGVIVPINVTLSHTPRKYRIIGTPTRDNEPVPITAKVRRQRIGWATNERLAVVKRLWPTYLPSCVIIAILRGMAGPQRITSNGLTNAAVYYHNAKRPHDIRSNRDERRKSLEAAVIQYGIDVVSMPLGKPLQEMVDWLTPERAAMLKWLWPGYLHASLIFTILSRMKGPQLPNKEAMGTAASRRLDLHRPPDIRRNNTATRAARAAAWIEFGVGDDPAVVVVEIPQRAVVSPVPAAAVKVSVPIRHGNVGGVHLVTPGTFKVRSGGFSMLR